MNNNDIKRIYKIIAVGDERVGKTSIIRRFTNSKFQDDYIMTIGANMLTQDVKIDDGSVIKLTIWDSIDGEGFSYMRSTFYKGTMGVLLVFDVTKETTFNNINRWIEEVNTFLRHVPKFLVGNKIDLKENREVTRKTALNFAEKLNIHYVETSAKTGENVNDSFIKLAKQIKENLT